MLPLLAHAESPETHVAALLIGVVALAAGFVLGRLSARRAVGERRTRD